MGSRCRCGAGVQGQETLQPSRLQELRTQGEGRVSTHPALSLNPGGPRPPAQSLGHSPGPLPPPQPNPDLPPPTYRWPAPVCDFREPGQPGSPPSCKCTPGAPCLTASSFPSRLQAPSLLSPGDRPYNAPSDSWLGPAEAPAQPSPPPPALISPSHRLGLWTHSSRCQSHAVCNDQHQDAARPRDSRPPTRPPSCPRQTPRIASDP